jgi:hypothetical protein
MKFYFLIVSIAVLISCKCEGTFTSMTFIQNSPGHIITITYYKKSGFSSLENVMLLSNQDKKVDESGGRGRGFVQSFTYGLSQVDSLIINYDDNRKITHYGRYTSGNNRDAILYTSPRSLFNEANYVRKTLIDDRCYLETEYRYTFTEQDYLKAK